MKMQFWLLLSAFCSIAYGAAHYYDVDEFDVEGVKIGMTFEEAKVAALTGMKVKESAMSRIGERKHKVTGGDFYSEFMVTSKVKGVYKELRVLFIENILNKENEDRSVVVYEIRLNRPIDDENIALSKKYVNHNYGAPTIVRKENYLQWCDKGAIDPNYERCHPDSASLSLLETLLVLDDPAYNATLREYLSSQ